MDIEMASRIAVPPRESIFVSPSSIEAALLVNGRSRYASSLKFTTNTSSFGFEALIKPMAAAATFERLSRMLPLSSISTPMDTGTSSRLNSLICCSTPFSYTLNAFCARFPRNLPFLSRTVACRTTSLVSARKTASSWLCAPAVDPAAAQTTRMLTRRCIVAKTEKRFQWWQPPGLHECDLDPAIPAVPLFILRCIADYVLVAELDSDLRGDIGKLGQVLDVEASSAGLLGQLTQQAGSVHF